MSNGGSRVTVMVQPDELRLLELIRTSEADTDLEVHRRDGKIVNVTRTTIHRKEFTSAQLREAQGQATP